MLIFGLSYYNLFKRTRKNIKRLKSKYHEPNTLGSLGSDSFTRSYFFSQKRIENEHDPITRLYCTSAFSLSEESRIFCESYLSWGNLNLQERMVNKTDVGPMRLYVGSLHFNITEEMLKGIFEPFGNIQSIQLMTDQVRYFHFTPLLNRL